MEGKTQITNIKAASGLDGLENVRFSIKGESKEVESHQLFAEKQSTSVETNKL